MNAILKWIAFILFHKYILHMRELTAQELNRGRIYMLRCMFCGEDVYTDGVTGTFFCECHKKGWHVQANKGGLPLFWVYDFPEAERYERNEELNQALEDLRDHSDDLEF